MLLLLIANGWFGEGEPLPFFWSHVSPDLSRDGLL